MFKKISLSIFIMLFVCSHNAGALSVGQADFPDSYEEDIGEKDPLKIKLLGAGLARFMVYKIIAVGLYVEEEASSIDVNNDIYKRIDVEYFSKVSRKNLIKTTNKGISDNVNHTVLKELQERIDQVNSYFEDVEAGDRYTFSYRPGVGTEIALNGKSLGTIEGIDFANALFSIYIGNKPIDERIKRSLLERMENERVSF